MRLWSIHPAYLDTKGLLAVWRESLLAKKVLQGKTKGYKHHPQLDRFKAHPNPILAINAYLFSLWKEAKKRGYHFNRQKVGTVRVVSKIAVKSGQVEYEFNWLATKLKKRSPKNYRLCLTIKKVKANPFFKIFPGAIESWERPEILTKRHRNKVV